MEARARLFAIMASGAVSGAASSKPATPPATWACARRRATWAFLGLPRGTRSPWHARPPLPACLIHLGLGLPLRGSSSPARTCWAHPGGVIIDFSVRWYHPEAVGVVPAVARVAANHQAPIIAAAAKAARHAVRVGTRLVAVQTMLASEFKVAASATQVGRSLALFPFLRLELCRCRCLELSLAEPARSRCSLERELRRCRSRHPRLERRRELRRRRSHHPWLEGRRSPAWLGPERR